MKNYGDLGGCYPPRPTASTDNQFLDLHNSLQDAQPHSLIVDEALPFLFALCKESSFSSLKEFII